MDCSFGGNENMEKNLKLFLEQTAQMEWRRLTETSSYMKKKMA